MGNGSSVVAETALSRCLPGSSSKSPGSGLCPLRVGVNDELLLL